MTDTYADFTATDAEGAELSVVWLKNGSARIYIAGDQPLDQPACSFLANPEDQARLAAVFGKGHPG